MAFTQKLITVEFNLANGNFQGGGNTATVSGLRVAAVIENLGGISQGTADLRIYGLPLSMMNQLSTIGRQTNLQAKNNIAVLAGDSESGMSLVFEGQMFTVFVDAAGMPQVALVIGANGHAWDAVRPVPPISKSGSQDVAGMMGALAGQMGLTLENNGVNVKLSNPYYPGSPWTQAWRIAKHANVDMFIDRGVMAIMPAGQPRQGDAVLISPQTGMVGYPAFDSAALIVRALYNPAVKFGGKIQVQSDLTPACGLWRIRRLVYELESLTPHGRWFMVMECDQVGDQAPPG